MKKPNLLFLYTDEQAFNTLAAYGNTRIQMPNLNRLAEQSVVFDQAYVTQPVCTPSRSTLLTGLYPHTNGCTTNNIPLRTETPCLPELVKDGDYVTAHHGKWHLGDEIFAQHGFNEWRAVEAEYWKWYSAGRDPNTRTDYHRFLIEKGFAPKDGKTFRWGEAAALPEEVGKPAYLAGEASRFIRENKGSPFILYVNFLEPHMPFTGPRDKQYDPAQIPLPPNFESIPGPDQTLKARALYHGYQARGATGISLKTEAGWRQLIAQYWGLCSLVDTHVGTILKTLDECGLTDNTIIVFTSDHGDMMGSHQLVAKTLMFQEAVRVPFMIHLTGQKKGKRVMGPVSQIDVVPTLLDLMGQPIPKELEGKSLRPWMEGKGTKELKEDVIVEWNGTNTGIIGENPGEHKCPEGMQGICTPKELFASLHDPVRTIITPDGWKFSCSPIGEHQLYNLKDDPGDTRNLAKDPAKRALMDELRHRIQAWQVRTCDKVRL